MRLFLITCLCLVAACSGPDTQEHRVRHPQLDPLEEQVRRTLENAVNQWREQLNAAATPDALAQSYAQLGQIYLAHGFHEAAADALEYATTLNTDNPHWYYYFAVALERNALLDESERALSRSLALRNSSEVRLLRARVRSRIEDDAGALADIQRLLEDDARVNQIHAADLPDSWSSQSDKAAWYALRAEVLASTRRYTEAVESLEAALNNGPEVNGLHVPLATLQHRLGNSTRAFAHLKDAGIELPNDAKPLMQALSSLTRGSQYYIERGRQWMESRNFQQAADDFAVAADIAPSNYEARISYGRALEIVGQVDAAVEQYTQALLLDEQSSVAHFFLGALYERQLQDANARIHYARAVDADPDYLPPTLSLAHALFRNQDYREALDHYTYYANARKNHLESRYYAGLAALALGDCEAAPVWFEQAASVNPHSRAAQEGIARSFAICSDDPGELSRAQDIGERLEEDQPDASAAATLAMVYAALNDFESATRLQKLAVRRSSEERANGQRDRLTQYESGIRAQVAWLAGDPVFDPPRLTMRVL